jgi:hypothetical protein
LLKNLYLNILGATGATNLLNTVEENLIGIKRKWAMELLLFLNEKRDGTIKSWFCANGSMQRIYMDQEGVSSPTVSTESTLLTAVIEAKEDRNVTTCDIPNAFI